MTQKISLFQRIKIGEFEYKLACLQIISITLMVVPVLVSILLFHHQTDDYFIDIWKYLSSIKLAFPPLLLLLSGYILAFLFGASISETPKLVLKYLRNKFFQNPVTMIIFILTSTIYNYLVIHHIKTTPPPKYNLFVSQILGGESDDFEVAKKYLKKIKTLNEVRAENFQLVLDVFHYRNKINTKNLHETLTKARIFVRALDANLDDEIWQHHPLRLHTLAEAYSMWAQAIFSDKKQQSNTKKVDAEWKEISNKSLELYERVYSSESNLSTKLLKASALHNKGNVLLYTQQFKKSLEAMERALVFNPNTSTYSNLVAIYVLLGNIPKAIEKGLEGKEWALNNGKALRDISNYAGILGNMGFAQMIKGDFQNATENLNSQFNLLNDELSQLNLVVALAFQGNKTQAKILMAKLKVPPLELNNQADRVRHPTVSRCAYLIWEIISDDLPPSQSAAYLHTYLEQARTETQLNRETLTGVLDLRKKAWNNLLKSQEPCSYFSLVPKFKNSLVP